MLHNPLGALSRFPPLIVATARRRRVLARPVKQCVGCCELSYRAARGPEIYETRSFLATAKLKRYRYNPPLPLWLSIWWVANLIFQRAIFWSSDLLARIPRWLTYLIWKGGRASANIERIVCRAFPSFDHARIYVYIIFDNFLSHLHFFQIFNI